MKINHLFCFFCYRDIKSVAVIVRSSHRTLVAAVVVVVVVLIWWATIEFLFCLVTS